MEYVNRDFYELVPTLSYTFKIPKRTWYNLAKKKKVRSKLHCGNIVISFNDAYIYWVSRTEVK